MSSGFKLLAEQKLRSACERGDKSFSVGYKGSTTPTGPWRGRATSGRSGPTRCRWTRGSSSLLWPDRVRAEGGLKRPVRGTP